MEQSFWQNNRNRNCWVAFGTLKSARPIGILRAEELNEREAFYLSVEFGISGDKLIVQFACQGNIDGVVDRNVIVKGKVEGFLEQIWGWGGNVYV